MADQPKGEKNKNGIILTLHLCNATSGLILMVFDFDFDLKICFC